MAVDERQELVACVRAMYDAFNARDVGAALKYVHPDIELRPAGTAAVTGRAVYAGHEGIREYFADVAQVWPEGLEVRPVDFRAVAGSVVAFGTVHGDDGSGPMQDDVVWVWRLRDGLVTSGQVFSTRGAAIKAARHGGG